VVGDGPGGGRETTFHREATIPTYLWDFDDHYAPSARALALVVDQRPAMPDRGRSPS